MDIQKENNLIQEAFEVEADEVGFCLDQKWGDYENPYENSDTALAFNLFKKGWQAAKAQTPVKLDRDTARQKLAMMWRGESTEINGRTVIFNESGCFDVRQDFGSGHFSQSLKATLDYLFQQRQSL